VQQKDQLAVKLKLRVRDLFNIFPDLPWPRRRPLSRRPADVRRRTDEIRDRFPITTANQRALARRAQARWRRKVGGLG
jgi:hypothetical protein